MSTRKPLGGFTDAELRQLSPDTWAQGWSGKWHVARPLRYPGVLVAIRCAWDVLIGKADALYWEIDLDTRKDFHE